METKIKCPHCEGGIKVDVSEVKMQSQAETKKLDNHNELLEACKNALKAINQRLSVDGADGAFISEIDAVIELESVIDKAEA